MKQHLPQLRPATAALFAALVLPIAPVFAQDTTAAPPPVISAPPPPAPVTVAPLPPVATPRVTPRPAPAPAPVARTTQRTTTQRITTRTVNRAPARAPAAAAPAPAPAPVAQAPAETAPPPVAPVETAPPPVAPAAPAENPAPTTRSMLPWLIGGLALLALLAGFFLFRRRRTDDTYVETYEPAPPREVEREVEREPAFIAPIDVAPVAAEPIFVPVHDPVPEARPAAQPVADDSTAPLPPPEEIAVAEADHADVEALAAASAPVAGRPWLEFLMRPMRAGTNRDNTIVQFELTVGNTGDAPARDVRISTWVVAAGEGTDYERSLIEPPADAAVEQVSIDPGEGATVEAKIGLAKDGIDESVLPVVVADARYTLPDGSEGRTHASFAVGVPAAESGELQPFPTDRSSGLRENVEARLHGEPERV
jgi:hypothetical protein